MPSHTFAKGAKTWYLCQCHWTQSPHYRFQQPGCDKRASLQRSSGYKLGRPQPAGVSPLPGLSDASIGVQRHPAGQARISGDPISDKIFQYHLPVKSYLQETPQRGLLTVSIQRLPPWMCDVPEGCTFAIEADGEPICPLPASGRTRSMPSPIAGRPY